MTFEAHATRGSRKKLQRLHENLSTLLHRPSGIQAPLLKDRAMLEPRDATAVTPIA